MSTTAAPDPSAELKLFPLSSPVLEVWFHGERRAHSLPRRDTRH